MSTIKINEQIAFLRKQKGLTQEELALALGVTNQAVSKWESAQCCPDIQLLPAIADFFGLSADELLGRSVTPGLGDICLKIRSYFANLPEKETFESAYRIAALLHEAVVTDGYKDFLPWKANKDYATDVVMSWGTSIRIEPEGSSGRKNNSIFFTIGQGHISPTVSQLRTLQLALKQISNLDVLKTMFALYSLTYNASDKYADIEAIAGAAHITPNAAEEALQALPVSIKEQAGAAVYRLEDSFMHIPTLLSFFC